MALRYSQLLRLQGRPRPNASYLHLCIESGMFRGTEPYTLLDSPTPFLASEPS
jgi:hypothetical protein